MECTGLSVPITRSPQYSAALDIIRDAKLPWFSGCSDSWPLQPPTSLHQYPAKMRPPALGLELRRFQIAYCARQSLVKGEVM